MIEQGKTLLLTVLVVLSVVLSTAIWNVSPNFDPIDAPQYASNIGYTDPRDQRSLEHVTMPRAAVLHLGEGRHKAVFPGQSPLYDEVVSLVKSASIFDVDITTDYGDAEWQKIVNEGPCMQLDFDVMLTASLLDKQEFFKFNTRIDPSMQMKTLYLFRTAEDKDWHALFYGGPFNMYKARVEMPKERAEKLLETAKDLPPYGLYGQSLHRNFYLPLNRMPGQEYAVVVSQELNVQHLTDSFFIDKSLTSQVRERDGSQIFTDGSRSVRVGAKDGSIDYHNLEAGKPLRAAGDHDLRVHRALSFVNDHGGMSGQQVLLHEIPRAETETLGNRHAYEFRQIVFGAPIIGEAATVYVNVAGGDVVAMRRSKLSVTSKPYKAREDFELLSGPEVLQLIDRSAWVDRNRITDVYLAYLMEPEKEQVAKLRPVWVVEQAVDARFAMFDARTGERLREEEGLLSGLE
jgi:regulatory protein YycH of two-component signal transduction system YycFG